MLAHAAGAGLAEWAAYNEKTGSAIVPGDTVSAGTEIEPEMLSFYDGYCKTPNARP